MTEAEVEFPRIYCVNLKASTSRRSRMERRFAHHGLSQAVTFIEAIPRDSPLVGYYSQGLTCPAYGERKWHGELACYASHLKAIRQFLHDGGEMAIICEDDILLANNFLERYVKVTANFPPKPPLVTFCYMMNGYDACHWSGQQPDKKNLLTIDMVNTWGAQMYWISRDYAMQVLTAYDRPFREVSNTLRTSEVIIRESKGYMAWPPLVIEDGIDSDREPEDLPYHHPHFKYWGYENYNSTEVEHISPLAEQKALPISS